MKRRSSILEAEGPSSILHAVPRTRRAVVVQKFGGTSVGSIERIRAVARRAVATQRSGVDVVVVVSAMAGETNRLLALASLAAPVPDRSELDVIAAAGEQVTAGLLSLSIMTEGAKARSFLGTQVRILTDSAFGNASVRHVEPARLRESLERGEIPVVAGFQGVDRSGRLSTLGRGGSDTTAVVIAAALGATCEIYTDVDGVYTADPSLCPGARKLERCSLGKMLTLASHGAKVLHPRSVAIAKAHGVTMHVRSSFNDDEGTILTRDEEPVEGSAFVGVALDRAVALLTVSAGTDADAVRLLAKLAGERIVIDMVSRGSSTGTLTFTVGRSDVARALLVVEQGSAFVEVAGEMAKVTMVGDGLSAPAVVERFLRAAISDGAYPVAMIADEGSLRCVVEERFGKALVAALHAEFFLEPQDENLESEAIARTRRTA